MWAFNHTPSVPIKRKNVNRIIVYHSLKGIKPYHHDNDIDSPLNNDPFTFKFYVATEESFNTAHQDFTALYYHQYFEIYRGYRLVVFISIYWKIHTINKMAIFLYFGAGIQLGVA